MKQTAVEWLDAHVNRVIDLHKRKLISEDKFRSLLIEYRKQAKEMEKEYLEQFYNQGYTQCSIEDLKPTSRDRFVDAEDYYNKTFKLE